MHEIIRLRDVEKYAFRKISAELGIPDTTIRDFYMRRSYKDFWLVYDEKPTFSAGHKKPYEPSTRLYGKNKTFVITSAQNNTAIHKQFFDSLLRLCEHRGAELLISTFIYNKNGFQNGEGGKDIWYDPKIKPYICNERLLLADDLIFCGEMNILPTAGCPESGFESYCGNRSGIIPHTKQRMKPLAAPISSGARHLYTSGAVTRLNYIEQKAGQKAAYHHIFGALIVEVDEDGDSFVRQINASEEDGTFYDLDYFYAPHGYAKATDNVAAINWGDLHLEVVDPVVALNAFGLKYDYPSKSIMYANKNNMLDVLRPKIQFASDTADFKVRNHHNINDPHFRFSQFIKQDDSVRDSIKFVADFLNMMSRPFSKIVVVEANHDLALMKWIKTADYKHDPANAVFFLECQLATYKAIERQDKDFHLFKYVLELLQPDISRKDVQFLSEGESFTIGNIECGYHGHLGPNGARGSAKGFKHIGTRVNLNHSHSACIDDGVFQAGTCSKLRLGYNDGSPSSWSHSHIITYKNFKRTMVTMKNGKWRREYA
jgi:hypothetical protein